MGKTKHILQKKSNDCGIACMAMLLGVSYRKARTVTDNYFKNVIEKPFDGMDYRADKAVAAAFGEDYRTTRVNKANRKALVASLEGRRAILCVPARDDSEEWHAVYWDGDKLFDPSPTCPYPKNGELAFKKMTMFGSLVKDANDEDTDFI